MRPEHPEGFNWQHVRIDSERQFSCYSRFHGQSSEKSTLVFIKHVKTERVLLLKQSFFLISQLDNISCTHLFRIVIGKCLNQSLLLRKLEKSLDVLRTPYSCMVLLLSSDVHAISLIGSRLFETNRLLCGFVYTLFDFIVMICLLFI